MTPVAKETPMERKLIRISSKRQVTIPQRYFDRLGFGQEAECILHGDELILRPSPPKVTEPFQNRFWQT